MGIGETQPTSNLSSKFSTSIYTKPRVIVSYLLCTHNTLKFSFPLHASNRSNQTPLGFGSIFSIRKNLVFWSCNQFNSLVVCVYKNKVITHYSYYQEIDKQNGKGFIIDLVLHKSKIYWSAYGTFLFMFSLIIISYTRSIASAYVYTLIMIYLYDSHVI